MCTVCINNIKKQKSNKEQTNIIFLLIFVINCELKMKFSFVYLGPIAIDQVDPQGNFIVVENAGSTGKDQDLKGWTLRRKIDSKDDIVYKFPDNFVLKSRSRIRILSRNASRGSSNDRETLVAEGVQTWGTGSNMVTRLLDFNGDEKALFNQKFQ